MRILVSTFGSGDADRVLQAMKRLPYERVVLVGGADAEDSEGLRKIRRVEGMAGNDVAFELVAVEDFMVAVDEISDVLSRSARGMKSGDTNQIILNIGGGGKLLGDAALFAAFRLGIETYLCEGRAVRLPVLKGVTVVNRFTVHQIQFINSVGESWTEFERLALSLRPLGRQSIERTLRQVRSEGVVKTEVRSGKIHVALTPEGREVARVLKLAQKDLG